MERFGLLFAPVIQALHAGAAEPSTADHDPHALALAFPNLDPQGTYIRSTRIRLARNLCGYRLMPTITRQEFDHLAVAINTGTNLPSVATPNGQAAFLFLLTSALAPLIRLSYGRMVIMALPYTVVMGATGLACVALFY